MFYIYTLSTNSSKLIEGTIFPMQKFNLFPSQILQTKINIHGLWITQLLSNNCKKLIGHSFQISSSSTLIEIIKGTI